MVTSATGTPRDCSMLRNWAAFSARGSPTVMIIGHHAEPVLDRFRPGGQPSGTKPADSPAAAGARWARWAATYATVSPRVALEVPDQVGLVEPADAASQVGPPDSRADVEGRQQPSHPQQPGEVRGVSPTTRVNSRSSWLCDSPTSAAISATSRVGRPPGGRPRAPPARLLAPFRLSAAASRCCSTRSSIRSGSASASSCARSGPAAAQADSRSTVCPRTRDRQYLEDGRTTRRACVRSRSRRSPRAAH